MGELNVNEINDLREIAISKIKVAYNRSIDTQATHTALLETTEKKRKILILYTLILNIVVVSFILLSLIFNNDILSFILNLISGLISLFSIILIIFGIFQVKKSRIHSELIIKATLLRKQSTNFMQNKLDNLDKQDYINELKALEINDKDLKEKSNNLTMNLSTKIITLINYKLIVLKNAGFEKYRISQQDKDSATKKLNKFTALRTCEAWIKFD
jgi:hypothetical protein